MTAARTVDVARAHDAAARTLPLQLLAAIRNMQIRARVDAATSAQFEGLLAAIRTSFTAKDGELELKFCREVMLLNGAVVHTTRASASLVAMLAHMFEERKSGGVIFDTAITPAALGEWIVAFAPTRGSEWEIAELRRSLDAFASRGIRTLDLQTWVAGREVESVRLSHANVAIQRFARLTLAFRAFIQALGEHRDPFALRIGIVRAVQEIVDTAESHGLMLLDVLDVRRAREESFRAAAGGYAASHAASTCVYAVLIGALLGLDRSARLDLGTSAILAKVGFALLPESLTEKPGRLTDAEKASIAVATVRAVQQLIGRTRLSDAMMRRTIVAYEHPRPYIQDGKVEDLHLYARITAVADAFDAMCSARVWREGFPKDVALESLRRQAGTRFDPLVITALDVLLSRWSASAAPCATSRSSDEARR